MAREPRLACGALKVRRWVYEGGVLARPGPAPHPRVGKSEKVVKRRGGAVLVLVGEFFFRGSRVGGLDLVVSPAGLWPGPWGARWCRVGQS